MASPLPICEHCNKLLPSWEALEIHLISICSIPVPSDCLPLYLTIPRPRNPLDAPLPSIARKLAAPRFRFLQEGLELTINTDTSKPGNSRPIPQQLMYSDERGVTAEEIKEWKPWYDRDDLKRTKRHFVWPPAQQQSTFDRCLRSRDIQLKERSLVDLSKKEQKKRYRGVEKEDSVRGMEQPGAESESENENVKRARLEIGAEMLGIAIPSASPHLPQLHGLKADKTPQNHQEADLQSSSHKREREIENPSSTSKRRKLPSSQPLTQESGAHLCTICSQTFQTQEEWNQHVTNEHCQPAGQTCTFCGKVLATAGGRNRHIRRMHASTRPSKWTFVEWRWRK